MFTDKHGLFNDQNQNTYVKQNEVKQGRPLNDCEKELLAPWYPESELNAARINMGIPLATQVFNGDTNGVTLDGNQIYLNPGAYTDSPEGISLLGHEMYHHGQRTRMGDLQFDANYIGQALKNDSGPSNSLETGAYAIQAEIYAAYRGTCTCKFPMGSN